MPAVWNAPKLAPKLAQIGAQKVLEQLDLALDRLQRKLYSPTDPIALMYGAVVTPDLKRQVTGTYRLSPTNGNAFAIAQALNRIPGTIYSIEIRNSTAGALGVATWDNSYNLLGGAWTQPAAGTSATITFYVNTEGSSMEIARAPTPAGTGTGGGEANTGANVNLTGVGVFKQKVGVQLQFKGVDNGSSRISVGAGAGDTIAIDVVEANLVLGNMGGSVGTTQITADAVTYPKMQNVSASQRALGRNTVGAGDPEEVTASQLLDWIGSTRGSHLYRGATGWAILAPGNLGDVLTAQGAGADPIYVTPAGGSGATLTRIAGNTGAAGADVTIEHLTANAAANATTTLATIMTITGVGVGVWKIKALLICQSSNVANGPDFAINHTGTATLMIHSLAVTTGGAAASGVIKGVGNAVANVAEGKPQRTINTKMGAFIGVDIINSNVLVEIEGVLVVTVSGNVQLLHCSNAAVSTQVMANSILELTKC